MHAPCQTGAFRGQTEPEFSSEETNIDRIVKLEPSSQPCLACNVRTRDYCMLLWIYHGQLVQGV